ncbi:MAG: IS1 family transposase [Fimbriimonas ginsengisoli]|uniref:IS1 family transposase n=1 Tax=Fimbriimonas ginsengisoli TaxID=1005039 RepID=A0A931LWF2_FIMGI|nr:IS1 family transposase [Fimbriimonas ginsengisoli]
MANVLRREKQEAIIRCLVDGSSIRATERMTETHRDTIMRLMVRVGDGCARLLDEEMRNLSCQRIECDELWGFIGKKQRHVREDDDRTRVGDIWTWVALDSDTKLVPAFRVGKRDLPLAREFLADLAGRLTNRVQLSTDAMWAYLDAVQWGFGGKVDWATVVKTYEAEPIGPGRYSPPKVIATTKMAMMGDPDEAHISTSFVERQNLTMRMSMRRLTRLTNGFSKKLENHKAATALHFAHYNFCRVHRTLKTTPAVAAGVMYQPWTVADLLDASV